MYVFLGLFYHIIINSFIKLKEIFVYNKNFPHGDKFYF